MEKKQFQAESKRLLDLMIHSIYSHKDIFLRELISNASDATDKLYYHAMQQGQTGILRDNLPITITIDKDARTLTVSDHGCGMSVAEMEENLGTIAHSGSNKHRKNKTRLILSVSLVSASTLHSWLHPRLKLSPVHRALILQTAGFPTAQMDTPLGPQSVLKWVLISF